VRYELFNRTGYFVTESSEHLSEYVPWFIKRDRPDLVERYNIPLDEYITRCEDQIARWDRFRTKLEDPRRKVRVKPSGEYGSLIIHSMETGIPRVIYGNVINDGLISNLPPGCCVEVPCLVDRNGIQPSHIGSLPPHLAALMPDKHQRSGLDRRGGDHKRKRAHLSRRHAGPAHRSRA
jgi:alpha-galactosidase